MNKRESLRLIFDDVLAPNPLIEILDVFTGGCCRLSTMQYAHTYPSKMVVFDSGCGTALSAYSDHEVSVKAFKCSMCLEEWTFCGVGKCFWKWKKEPETTLEYEQERFEKLAREHGIVP